MQSFLQNWSEAAMTSFGLFWMAFWAFGLGYVISSLIQIFVTRARMRKSMGEAGAQSVFLGTFFGFISSSCSFAALATTRALFAKGAGFIPSLAFLLSSTNLVIELGIVIGLFLGWQFVVGEYVGGILLVLFMWGLVRLSAPHDLIKQARKKARSQIDEESERTKKLKDALGDKESWRDVAIHYIREWDMVWKDVTIGFTVAGIIATFVPQQFFHTLFIGAGSPNPAFWEVVAQSLVGPIAAFFTFIGSMGNIPLAAVLYSNGVSFAGIMAFIFSDLVVFPVLRIQSKYYGWKMALYILGIFLVILIAASLLMHYGFAALNILPEGGQVTKVKDRDFFAFNYTFFLNLAFLLVSAAFLIWKWKTTGSGLGSKGESPTEKVLYWLALGAFLWLGAGMVLNLWF